MVPLLFRLPTLMGPLKYTGIGARQTPEAVQRIMQDVAQLLGQRGTTLRSGHAAGADYAFEKGAAMAGHQGLPLQFGRNPLIHTKGSRNFPETEGSHLTSTQDITRVLREETGRDARWVEQFMHDHPAEFKKYVEQGLGKSIGRRPASSNPQALAEGLDINLGGAKASIPLTPAEDIAEQLWVVNKSTGEIKFPASPKTKLKAGEEIVDLSKHDTFQRRVSGGDYGESWSGGKFEGEQKTQSRGKKFPGRKPVYPSMDQATQKVDLLPSEGLEYGAAPGATVHSSGPTEIYLPWNRFTGGGPQLSNPSSYQVTGMDPIARAFVRGELATDASGKMVRSRFMHPSAQPTGRPLPEVLEELESFGRMGPSPLPGNPLAVRNPEAVEALMSRNMHQLLGKDLMKPDPSDFLLAYTPGGQAVGGTGANLRAAQGLDIPILNLGGGKKAVERFERPNRMHPGLFEEMRELLWRGLHGLDV